MIGVIMDWLMLIEVGIVFFSTIVIFNLITLPVEFNASSSDFSVASCNYYALNVLKFFNVAN